MFRSIEGGDRWSQALNADLSPDLVQEYKEGVKKLEEQIQGYKLKPIAFIAIGSLTRRDKGLRFNPMHQDILLSDADFVCIVNRPIVPRSRLALEIARKGKAVLTKQPDDGQNLPPFSVHIPSIHIEFLTPDTYKERLTSESEILEHHMDTSHASRSPSEDPDELADEIRRLKAELIGYEHLTTGILISGMIPDELHKICHKISEQMRILEDRKTAAEQRAKRV